MDEIKNLTPLAQFGVGGAAAYLMYLFVLRAEKRYEALAHDYRQIVENNTTALVKIEAAIVNAITSRTK